jgi:hypothetical protein
VCISIDANCGIAEEKDRIRAYLFETTIREGYPWQSLEGYLIGKDTDMGEFFADLIDGRQGNVGWSKNWGVVTVLGTGQFPHEFMGDDDTGSFHNQPVRFPFDMDDWSEHVQPGWIKYDPKAGLFRVADCYEDVCTVTYDDADIAHANERCMEMMKKIQVRAPFYRTDIGEKFQKEEMPKLRKWGYLA